jgi:hypothetical protein
MRVRRRLVAAAVGLAIAAVGIALAVYVGSSAHAGSGAHVPNAAVVSVGGSAGSPAISPGFLGLSLEYTAILPYAGSDPRALDPAFVQLIRNLTPGQAPDLRIGGDSTDWAWYPARGLAKPSGVRFTLTSQWLAVMHALSATLGARLIMGIDLEAGSRRLAAAEAHAFETRLGRAAIEALEPGNEPELYPRFAWYVTPGGRKVTGRAPGYDFRSFLADFSAFAHALPGPLAGPTTGSRHWMPHTGEFLGAEPRVRVVTLHRYPVQTCYISTTSPQYPTVAHLLAPYATSVLGHGIAPYVKLAHAHHLPLRVDEINTDSCGSAPGVSDAFVSALWAIDALFELARVGVDGVNIDTYPGVTYQLFTVTHDAGVWRASVKPDYYGLMMFAQAAPPGSRLLRTSTINAAGIKTWATRDTDGHIRVVLINESARPRTIALTAAPGAATLERLRAPRLTSTSGVTLGGQSFAPATGALSGSSTRLTLQPRAGRYVFGLPADSAALVIS